MEDRREDRRPTRRPHREGKGREGRGNRKQAPSPPYSTACWWNPPSTLGTSSSGAPSALRLVVRRDVPVGVWVSRDEFCLRRAVVVGADFFVLSEGGMRGGCVYPLLRTRISRSHQFICAPVWLQNKDGWQTCVFLSPRASCFGEFAPVSIFFNLPDL